MNTPNKYTGRGLWFAMLMLPMLMTGCGGGSDEVAPAPAPSPTRTVPIVTTTTPASDAIAVAVNSAVLATFSEAMDASTMNSLSFTVVGAGEPALTGSISYDAGTKTASFISNTNFTDSTLYVATLTSSITSSAGFPMTADYAWSFTSGTTPDVTPPTVTSTIPVDLAIDVALNTSVSANFSEAFDPATVDTTSFTLSDGVLPVTGAVSFSNGNKVASFAPDSDLAASTEYFVTLASGITDTAVPANALVADVVWSFTTGTAPVTGPAAINLSTAGNFAIMSGTGITSADGSAVITGNIGASGIAGTSITVACSELPGFEMFTDDAAPVGACLSTDNGASATALADVITAYNAAVAAPAGVGAFLNLGAGTVTAQTLAPGVYTWTSAVSITGELILDGSATDVWIFQVPGTLGTDQTITLSGGALAKNVFWQVAGVVTLNTGAQFKGIVLAQTNVTMIAGTTITGRLLAQTAVTLGSGTVVTQPALKACDKLCEDTVKRRKDPFRSFFTPQQ